MEARAVAPALKERIRSLPELPGVYLFKDAGGTPIYIGKAVSLRKRVAGHFRHFGESGSKEGVMLSQVRWVDYIRTPTEPEALLLEASLVRENRPKYNSLLKDDKSYPFLKITGEEYPRLMIVRGRKPDGGKYFGPYTSGYLLQKAVRMLRRMFPMRTCRKLPKKVCLMYHIGQCHGPCVYPQAQAEYAGIVKELGHFLEGRRDTLVRHLSRQMKEYAREREYEKAQAALEQMRALSSVPRTALPVKDSGDVLEQLQRALHLPRLPRHIECFDISHLGGSQTVASMVVFRDASPSRADYRLFRIRTVEGIDDFKSMREAVGRRYARLVTEKQPLPDLVVIDGGKGQLGAALKAFEDAGASGQPVVAIAKQHEHLFVPGRELPHILPLDSPPLELIRRLRDEAHRFAVTRHRRLHRKAATVSVLDGIPGVGEKTRSKLLKRFGSLARLKRVTEIQLHDEAGIGPAAARRIVERLSAAS